MESVEKIKAHYNFTSDDAKNLKNLLPVMQNHSQGFVEGFYNYVKNFEDAPKFLKDPQTIKKHQDALAKWFIALFSGEYTKEYFTEIGRVGATHVKINLNAHYVNAAMHFVKRYITDVLKMEVKEKDELPYLSRSVEKILDINLDVFTSSYIEEERRLVFISHKVESFLIQSAKRFAYGLNLILVLGLVAMSVMVMGLFVYDLMHILEGEIEKGLLSTLGSLLMLWVVIELLNTEISHLRGGKFAIKVFVSVALVAVIRKILVSTLSGEVGAQITLIAALAVLGVVYWLIARVEQ